MLSNNALHKINARLGFECHFVLSGLFVLTESVLKGFHCIHHVKAISFFFCVKVFKSHPSGVGSSLNNM